MNELIQYTPQEKSVIASLHQAHQALLHTKDIGELMRLRGGVEGLRYTAKQWGASKEIVNQAVEMKLRIERGLGQRLADMEKAPGKRTDLVTSCYQVDDVPTLSEIGISKMQSSRWQSVAALPLDVFERYISETKNSLQDLATATVLKLSQKYQKYEKRKAQAPTLNTLPPTVNLYHAPFQDVCAELPDGSIDFILTDPPYHGEHLPLWLDLAVAAKRILKPGGYLFAYCGQMFLPDMLSMLGESLDYVWLAGIQHKHGYTQIWCYEILNAYKPILIYSNGKPGRSLAWLVDLFSGGQGDKEAHEWAQPETEATYFIEHVTFAGETVLDPFMGSGTIPRAAHKLGRHVIGCEIDEQHFLTARSTF